MAALFFEVDEIDIFLQDEQGRQVVDFLTGVACLASAKIKASMPAFTPTCVQYGPHMLTFVVAYGISMCFCTCRKHEGLVCA